ncbi:inactive dipeptidyl peptidase 10 isoform X1 [Synchiropus splendidus]|uniref:inactive dipeptidyl peptidase 10 isoform X1 n=1 Tax=Synchiropus splendidus TaxID=270530 RepID=UPI00237E1EDC|nr:inactive dipeptidyl peptidase 10 isoform X1 [Synchiropus splendidus]
MIATTQQNMTADLDLGSTDGPPRNWKGIGIAMMVILGVMSLVILSVVLLTPDDSQLLRRSHLTMDDLESETFKVHRPQVSWLNEHEVAVGSRDGHVLMLDLSSNIMSTLLDNSSLDLTSTQFQVSADKKFVLLAYNIRPVFSQSFTASYAVHDVASGDLLDLGPPEREKAALQHSSWGPQNNQLVFVFQGDIYYKPSVTSDTLRLTVSGQERNVQNGISDWIYEEEVLLSPVALWWSQDGARLAYLTINNSATPVMEIPQFLGGLYPHNLVYPYPKAGSSIPSVSLSVVNLYGPTHTVEMTPPDSVRSRDGYISMVTWISSTRLAVRWLNRAQNQSVLGVCEATTGACSEKHKMNMDIYHQQWKQDTPLFADDGSVFYTVLPAKQGARGEFRHVAALSAQQPVAPTVPARFLTSGSWDVTSLCALDEASGKIYFLSSEESRQSRHLYSVDVDGVFQRHCLTCDLLDDCSFFRAQFSPNHTHLILHCLGPGVPKVTVHSTKDLSSFVVLEDNSRLSEALEDKSLPEVLFRSLPSENHDLHLKVSLPPGYEANLHPLLLVVNGLPGSQVVTEEFSLDWTHVMTSQHGTAVVWVDSREGSGRPQKNVAVDPRKLVPLRVKHHLEVVEMLVQLPYIDDRRVALYGKAFGGYLTLKMLAASDKLFQCSAAAAPITDFRLYSAAFSERFLGLPAKEEHVYSTASLLEDVSKLKDENFLLLHGTADARVHFQHSAELLNRLVKVEANYSLQLYPDEGHDLREPRSVQHFQRTVVNYLHTCMQHGLLREPEEDEEDEEEED